MDEYDSVIGSVARADTLAMKDGFRLVHVAVFNTDGKLLIQQIGDVGTRSPGKWGSSVAGYLFKVEQPECGAVRRLHEEIGVDKPVEPVCKIQMPDGDGLE